MASGISIEVQPPAFIGNYPADPNPAKPYNILSLDGGGSRGVMEAVILKDMMACLTLVQRGELEADTVNFASEKFRIWLHEKLESVEDPLHPGDVFKMVAGTSTGALMAFGLLHGNEGARMSLDEVIEMYKENTEKIFPSWFKAFRKKFSKYALTAYSQDGLKSVLEDKERFGNLSLTTVCDESEPSIAAAVARRHNPPDIPKLEIFDTRLQRSHTLVEVLKASACAPVFFDAPTSIGDVDYIDGGVGGNCPLAQAIPRMAELAEEDGTLGSLQGVISIAPPREAEKKGKKGRLAWLPWFATQLTDGYPVYLDQEKAHPEAIFLRLTPQSKESQKFSMDSWKVKSMIDSIRTESQKDPAYFSNIFLASLLLAPSMDLTSPQNYRSLSEEMEALYLEESRFPERMKVVRARILASEKIHGSESEQLSEDYAYQAECYIDMGKYRKAIEAGQKSLKITENTRALTALGNSYDRLGQIDKAIEKHTQSLEMDKNSGDREGMSVSLNNLGVCYGNKGEYNTALKKYEECLVINREVYGDKHPMTASSIHNMADSYLRQEKFKLALEKYEDSLDICRDYYGDTSQHPDIARSLSGIGEVLIKLAKYPEAEEKLQDSLKMWQRIHSEPHDETAESLFWLGEVNFLQGKYKKAQEKNEDALQMCKAVYKSGHEDIDRCEARLREIKEKMRTDL